MLKENQTSSCDVITPCDVEHTDAGVTFALTLACWVCFVFAVLWSPLMAHAEDRPALDMELNSLAKTSSGGCRLNFILRNTMASTIEALAFEIVLFDKSGRVNNLLRLDGGSLSKGKTRVRQFDLKNSPCSNISRVLVNEITVCKGEGLTPRSCLAALKATSRTKIPFGL